MEQWHFFLHAALLLYCSDSLFVKCVVNVTKILKQTKLHPGDSELHVLLQQGRGPLPPAPAGGHKSDPHAWCDYKENLLPGGLDQKQVTSDWLGAPLRTAWTLQIWLAVMRLWGCSCSSSLRDDAPPWPCSSEPKPGSSTCTAPWAWPTGTWTRSWNWRPPRTRFTTVTLSSFPQLSSEAGETFNPCVVCPRWQTERAVHGPEARSQSLEEERWICLVWQDVRWDEDVEKSQLSSVCFSSSLVQRWLHPFTCPEIAYCL